MPIFSEQIIIAYEKNNKKSNFLSNAISCFAKTSYIIGIFK